MSVAGHARRVLAVTSAVPYTDIDEAFVQDELTEMIGQGLDLTVVPMRLRRSDPNAAALASGLAAATLAEPLVSPAVVVGAMRTLARRPGRSLRALVDVARATRGRRNLAVNATSLLKALWLADVIRGRRVTHVHAYWLSHTATAAWIAASIERVAWSATGYRWDIDAANALEPKFRTARFIRCADELGLNQLNALATTITSACPVILVRTGVALPPPDRWLGRPISSQVLVCPAAFVEKKGHTILVEAFHALRSGDPAIRLELFGDGPLRESIEGRLRDLGDLDAVTFHGFVPLGELRDFLLDRRPLCVLPSRPADGQDEGIPVTLIEAMACGSPVVSTHTGAIDHLVSDGCGLLVAPGDATALADAIRDTIGDPEGSEGRCRVAYQRIRAEFDLEETTRRMIELTTAPPIDR